MVSCESSLVEFLRDLLPAKVLLRFSSQLLGLPAATSPRSSALLSLFCFSLLTLSRPGISGSSCTTERNVGIFLPRWTTNESSEPLRRLSSLISDMLCCRELVLRSGTWVGVDLVTADGTSTVQKMTKRDEPTLEPEPTRGSLTDALTTLHLD
jgi:hypothetical protein